MQDFRTIQDLTDQELAIVGGGHRNHGAPLVNQNTPINVQDTLTSADVSVNAHAAGGAFHIDRAIAQTKSITIYENGESVSIAFGFAIGMAL
jgi:hypothetical protein